MLATYQRAGLLLLWTEFKTPRGSLSRDQRDKIAMLREVGYRVEIVRDPQVAEQIVEEYLNGNESALRDSSQK